MVVRTFRDPGRFVMMVGAGRAGLAVLALWAVERVGTHDPVWLAPIAAAALLTGWASDIAQKPLQRLGPYRTRLAARAGRLLILGLVLAVAAGPSRLDPAWAMGLVAASSLAVVAEDAWAVQTGHGRLLRPGRDDGARWLALALGLLLGGIVTTCWGPAATLWLAAGWSAVGAWAAGSVPLKRLDWVLIRPALRAGAADAMAISATTSGFGWWVAAAAAAAGAALVTLPAFVASRFHETFPWLAVFVGAWALGFGLSRLWAFRGVVPPRDTHSVGSGILALLGLVGLCWTPPALPAVGGACLLVVGWAVGRLLLATPRPNASLLGPEGAASAWVLRTAVLAGMVAGAAGSGGGRWWLLTLAVTVAGLGLRPLAPVGPTRAPGSRAGRLRMPRVGAEGGGPDALLSARLRTVTRAF